MLRDIDCYYSDEHRRINLNFTMLENLDQAIVNFYEDWIENVTDQYTEDTFFPMRHPVAVTSRFGQNQKLADTQELQVEECGNWAHECDYKHICFLTIALATHLR